MRNAYAAALEGYGFHFYSREPDEPPHVHVIRGGAQAKFWLSGFPDHELRRIAGKVREERETFLEVWYDFFGRR